jgi:CRISPR-associated protein Cmr2
VGKVATFSAGIVIAHIKTPLGEVLDWARRAEHKAKECRRGNIEKDAYCLTILRRSGEITQYTHGFTLEGGLDGMSVLRDLVDTIVKNRVSVSFIYSLSREFEPLLKAPRAIHAAMFQSEAKRLLNHAELPEGFDKRAVVDRLCARIDALVDKSGDKLTDVLNLLRSVAFIARQMGGER